MTYISKQKSYSLKIHKVMGSLLLTSFLHAAQTQAFDFSAGEVQFEWDNHLTYGAMYRTESPKNANTVPVNVPFSLVNQEQYLKDAAQAARVKNGNDGDLNFARGLVQNRISVLSEFSMNYKNFGVFIRGRAWYDDTYKNQNPSHWDGAALGYNNPNNSINNKFPSATVDYLGSEAELLDAYLYGNFLVGNHMGAIKIGKQVINWGESMAFANSINSAINPVDANSGTRAGVDLKETYLPTEAIYFQFALSDIVTLETFYQWKHRGTILLSSGSFFSETDMLGDGGEYSWSGPTLATRNNLQRDVKDDGQYGLAFKFFGEDGTEYGIYAVNAHDKSPSMQVNRSSLNTYDTWYLENRKVFAFSFSTVVGDTNISGEYSYRPNAPVVLSPGCADLSSVGGINCTTHDPAEVTDASYSQAQISFTNVRPSSLFYDQLTLAGEVVAWKYHGIDKAGVAAKTSDMFVSNTPYGVGTLLRANFDYFNAFKGVNISVPLTWQYGWKGTNQRTNSREKASIFSLGIAFTFPNEIETSLIYTQYDGEDDQLDPNFYSLSDRDNIAFSAKYSF